MSLIDFFDKGVELDADRACLIHGEDSRSYGDVQRSSCLIADALRRAGVSSGTGVAVLAHNAARPFECVLGALRAGCTWIPINARTTVDETVFILNRTDAGVLFYSAAFAPLIPAILQRCPRVSLAACIEGDGADGHPSLDAFCAGADDTPFTPLIGADALATLACSGGTTGLPKGVMTTHRTWAFRIAEVMQRLAHPRPVHLVAAPMTHGAGAGALELMPLGATHVVLQGFDAKAVIDAIGTHGVTHMFLPPTALYRLLSDPLINGGSFASLRYLICGGAPIAADRLREALRVFGPAMHMGYGGTEMGGGVCWHTGEAMLRAIDEGAEERLSSCGPPSPLMRVDVFGDDGAILPTGEAGELVVTGYNLASGYYKDEEETRRGFRNGGFHTGDIGFKDDGGRVYVSDRKKDMIISGGLNIYPSEIEGVLLMHPAVQDCAVVGVPDPYWGEAVTAVVEPRKNADVDLHELETLCRASLAGYKVPKAFHVWRTVPRSPVGKVLKRAVRDQLAAPQPNEAAE